jgi:hypothetical protein
VVRILGILFDNQVNLRKLIVNYCNLGENGSDILANIVALNPELKVLSLEGCGPITSAVYSLIPRLKKLTELNLSYCEVEYIHIHMLNCYRPMFADVNTCSRTPLEIHFIF